MPEFLLQVDAEEVEFASEKLGEVPVAVTVKIKNVLPDKYLFKIKCTSNDLFRIRPPLGYIKTGDTEAIRLTFKSGRPVPESGKHCFVIYYKKAEGDTHARAAWDGKEPDAEKRLYVNFSKVNKGGKQEEAAKDDNQPEITCIPAEDKKDEVNVDDPKTCIPAEEKKEEKKEEDPKTCIPAEEKKEEKKEDDPKTCIPAEEKKMEAKTCVPDEEKKEEKKEEDPKTCIPAEEKKKEEKEEDPKTCIPAEDKKKEEKEEDPKTCVPAEEKKKEEKEEKKSEKKKEKKEKKKPECVIDPAELKWDKAKGDKKIKITNNGTERKAVKMRCSDIELYRIDPVFTFVEAGKTLEIKITRLKDEKAKEDKVTILLAKCKDSDKDATAIFKNLSSDQQEKHTVPFKVG